MTFAVAAKGKGAVKAAAWSLLTALLLATTDIARAANPSVVFQSTDTPPFWCPALPENGLGGAILRMLSDAAGVQYTIEYLPVKRFRYSLATYIVGDPDILINQKRRAIFPISIFRSAFFYYKPHHDVIEFHSLRDLQGYTLGVLRGTLEDKEYFVNHGISVEESDSVDSLLRKLKKGRIDVCILVDVTGRFMVRQIFPEEQDNFIQVSIPGTVRPIAIMIDVDDPAGMAVAQRYRRVLDSALQSREYRGILERFYGKNNIPGDLFEQLQKFEQYYANDWDK